MRHLLIVVAALTLMLSACQAGDTSDTTEPETTTSTSTTTTTPSTTTSFPTTTTTTSTTTTTQPPTTEPTTTCSSPVGFTVDYPESWEFNEGDVVPACTMFDPDPFTVEEGTDERFAAINIDVENVDYSTATSSTATEDVTSLDMTTVDDHRAVRIEREASGEGLVPEGTLITSYYVELGVSDRVLIADTIDYPTIDYETAVDVLDVMVRTLGIDEERLSGIQPIAEFTTPPIETSRFPASGEPFLLTDVRHGVHQGFERVVFEFQDGTNFSYSIEYVEEAIPPSGDPVDISGGAILDVTMTPASGVDLSGDQPNETYRGPERIDIGSGNITEIVQVEDFESVLTWAIGLHAENDTAVDTLDNPYRLVIDIATG